MPFKIVGIDENNHFPPRVESRLNTDFAPYSTVGDITNIFDNFNNYVEKADFDSLISENSQVVNVKNFGAVGDGVANDLSAIQNTVNSAGVGGTVVIPEGVYGISDGTIRLPADITIVGDGAVIQRMDDTTVGTMVMNWEEGDTTTGGYDGNSNISLIGLTFNARGEYIQDIPANIVTFGHCRNIRVINCEFINTSGYHALELNAVDTALVHGCQFRGHGAYHGITEPEALQIDCASPGDHGLADNTMARNIRVSDCTFEASAVLPAHNTAIGSHNSGLGQSYDNIVVSNCHIRTTYRGIEARDWHNALIENCNIAFSGPSSSGVLQGIRMLRAHSCRAVGNMLTAPGGEAAEGQAINLGDSSITNLAAYNTVTGFNEGIYSGREDSRHNRIIGNMIEGTRSPGIVVNGSSDALVANNTVVNAGAGVSGGTVGAIRTTGNAQNTSVTGNHAIKGSADTVTGLSANAGTTNWCNANNFKGMTYASAGGGTVNTSANGM